MSESGITNPEKMSESGVEDPEKMSEYHTICNSRSYLSPSRSYLSVIPADVRVARGTSARDEESHLEPPQSWQVAL